MNKKSGIYYIKNETKNIFYIGSSQNIQTRIRQHFSDLKSNRHLNKGMQADFVAGDIFTHGIIETTPETSKYVLFEMERDTIEEYKKQGISLYNVYPAPAHEISKNFLVEAFATLYCKEHYGMTYPQFTAHFCPAEYTLHYLMIKSPENSEQLQEDFLPLIKWQKKKFYHETHERK